MIDSDDDAGTWTFSFRLPRPEVRSYCPYCWAIGKPCDPKDRCADRHAAGEVPPPSIVHLGGE